MTSDTQYIYSLSNTSHSYFLSPKQRPCKTNTLIHLHIISPVSTRSKLSSSEAASSPSLRLAGCWEAPHQRQTPFWPTKAFDEPLPNNKREAATRTMLPQSPKASIHGNKRDHLKTGKCIHPTKTLFCNIAAPVCAPWKIHCTEHIVHAYLSINPNETCM